MRPSTASLLACALLLGSAVCACGSRVIDSASEANLPTDASDAALDGASPDAGPEPWRPGEEPLPSGESCALTGTWEMVDRDPPCCGDDGTKPSFRFRPDYTFFGAPKKQPLDESSPIEGYWARTDPGTAFGGTISLRPRRGMRCDQEAGFSLSFEGCNVVSLRRGFDNCTGSRWYIAGTTRFTRQPAPTCAKTTMPNAPCSAADRCEICRMPASSPNGPCTCDGTTWVCKGADGGTVGGVPPPRCP